MNRGPRPNRKRNETAMKKLFATILILASAGLAPAENQPFSASVIPAGYSVQTIATPKGVAMEAGGLAFTPDGKAVYISTRHGDVWKYEPAAEKWSLFAEGLHEALGVLVDAKSGDVFVAQRPELTRLIDTDHDGKADIYKTVNAGWGFDGNYHEYCFGPVRDSKGNFYITLNLAHSNQGSVQGSIMGHPSHHRGWVIQVTPDGKFVPFASGLRSPCGIGISKDDEIFYTDNQGDWNATSTLHHVEQGRFYGNPASLVDDPAFAGKDLNQVPPSEFQKVRTMPVVWIPYGELAQSPGEPTFDYTGGKFGPFDGQIFVGDQTKSNIMRINLEKVDGAYQGAVFNFVEVLQSGVIRNAFAPDGSLWIGQTSRGWGARGGAPYGVQRIVWDGKTVPFEMHSISLTKTGFTIHFTTPVDAKAAADPLNYRVEHWHYYYGPKYGSPNLDLTAVKVESATVAADGRSVEIQLPLLAGKVYKIALGNIAAADGAKMSTNTGYYTLNRLVK
jgi:glucose/arabinose dehydrogenase